MNGPYSRAYNRSSNRSYGEGGLTGAAGYGAPRRNAALAYSYGGPFGAAPTNRTNRTNWSTNGLDLPKNYGTYGRTNLGRTNLGRTRTNVGGWGTERNATRGSNGRPASLVRPNNRRANNNKRNANRRVNNNNNWMNNNNTNRRVNNNNNNNNNRRVNNNNNNNNRRVNNNNNNGRNTRWAYAPSPYAPSPYAAPARTNSNASASANSSWARWLRGS